MLAFVFPGQGAQKVGMGQALAAQYPEAKQVFEQADTALGFSISKLCFEGPDDELRLTANSQPAILSTSVALLRVLEARTELKAEIVAGHSLGEFSALVCARAMTFEDAVRTVNQRGKFMQEAVPVGEGSMAAVMGLDPTGVEALCNDAAEGQVLCAANFNSPKQTVIAGHKAAIDRAIELAGQRDVIAKELPVSAPFHCPLMGPAAEKLKTALESISFSDPQLPVVTNVEAEPNRDGGRIAELLFRQVTGSVRWTESVKKMVSLGVSEFVEVGPGRALCGLIKQIDRALAAKSIQDVKDIQPLERTPVGTDEPATAEEGEVKTTHEDGRIEYVDGRIKDPRDGRVVYPNGKIVWPDGMVWDPEAPGAYGF